MEEQCHLCTQCVLSAMEVVHTRASVHDHQLGGYLRGKNYLGGQLMLTALCLKELCSCVCMCTYAYKYMHVCTCVVCILCMCVYVFQLAHLCIMDHLWDLFHTC